MPQICFLPLAFEALGSTSRVDTSEKPTCNSLLCGMLPNTFAWRVVAATAASLCTCTRSAAAARVILNSGFDKCCRGYSAQCVVWKGRSFSLADSSTSAARFKQEDSRELPYCRLTFVHRGNCLTCLLSLFLSEFYFNMLSPLIHSVLWQPLRMGMSFTTYRVPGMWMVPQKWKNYMVPPAYFQIKGMITAVAAES